MHAGIEEEKVYRSAIENDTPVSLLYLKILAIGPGQVGKSTFLRRLMGLMKWDIQTAPHETKPQGSTGQAELNEAYIKYNRRTAPHETKPQGSTGQAELNEAYIKYNRQTCAVSSVDSNSEWQVFEKEVEAERQINALTSLLNEQTGAVFEVAPAMQQEEKQTTNTTFNNLSSSSFNPNNLSDNENVLIEKSAITCSSFDSDSIASEEEQPESEFDSDSFIVNDQQQSESESSHLTQEPSSYSWTEETSTPLVKEAAVAAVPEVTIVDKAVERFEKLKLECRCNLDDDKRNVGSLGAIVNLEDIGGQPAFLEMLPSLTLGPAMYLVFMPLLQGLRTQYPVKFRCQGESLARLCKEYTFTSEEVIFTALSSIACFGNSDEEVEKYVSKESNRRSNSLALLLGTFADKLVNCSDDSLSKVKENEKQLRQQLQETEFYTGGLLEYSNPEADSQILFHINNENGGKEEVLKYRKLLEEYMEQKFKRYNIPAKWLMFSICLKILANKENSYMVSFDDCKKLGERFGMNSQVVKVALRFLHKYIGLVMYFPENNTLKDTVVCEPQVVFSSISELIFGIYDPHRRLIPASKCNYFIQTGCFSPEDINCESKELVPIEFLINLLTHLNIAAPIPSSPNEYFLPAVLQSAKVESLLMQPQGENDELLPEPLCIRFRTGYLPLGFVCALIANLISTEKLELLNKLQGQITYKNKLTFRLRGRYNIELISWMKFCEVRVFRAPNAPTDEEFHSSSCCPLIRDVLTKSINSVVNAMRQNSVFKLSQGYDFAFKCPHCHGNPGHEPLATIDSASLTNSPEDMTCVVCKTAAPLTPQMLTWFGKVSVHSHLGTVL